MATKKVLTNIDVQGELKADTIVKDGGTSSQFLKADGSVDSNTYVTSGSIAGTNLTTTTASTTVTINSSTGTNATISAADGSGAGVVTNGTQTFGGSKTFAGQTTFDNDVAIQEDGSNSHDLVFNSKQGGTSSNLTQAKIYSYAADDYEAAMIIGTQAGSVSIEPSIRIEAETNDVFFYEDITVGGVIKKNGGTSSQFLKADGSLDSSTYLTSGDVDGTDLSTTHGTTSVTINSSTGNNATINAATASAAGVMTNGTQTIGGTKTFSNGINVDGNIDIDGNFEVNGTLDVFNSTGAYQFQEIAPASASVTIGDMSSLSWGTKIKVEGNTGNVKFFTGSTENMRLTNGSVLHVDNDVVAFSSTISDRRLKEDIETIDNASETVSKLRGVSYKWKAGSRKGKEEIGLIAQEVEEVLPCLIKEHELPLTDGAIEGELYKTVDYEKIVGLLIEDSKEKDARIERLEAMVELMLKQK